MYEYIWVFLMGMATFGIPFGLYVTRNWEDHNA